jgi:hypothetical protein
MTDKGKTTVVLARRRTFHAASRQEPLRDTLLRWIEDPLKPRTDSGSLRINPTVLLLAVMAALAGATFVFFSLIQP